MDENNLSIRSVARQTLSQKAYESIKESILSGELEPGARLQEVRMAKLLGVSAAPVREAFRMLQAEGLIRIDPYKGAVVQKYSKDEMLDVIQCRIALETMALRIAYERLGTRLVERIGKGLKASAESEGVSDMVYVNNTLHQIWIQGCKNIKLIAFMDQLNDVVLREMNFSAIDERRSREIVAEHSAIYEALRSDDIELAVVKLSKHIQNGYMYSLDIQDRRTARTDRGRLKAD